MALPKVRKSGASSRVPNISGEGRSRWTGKFAGRGRGPSQGLARWGCVPSAATNLFPHKGYSLRERWSQARHENVAPKKTFTARKVVPLPI